MAAPSQLPTRDCRPDESLADHLRCLPRGLIPMPDDTTARTVEKVVALVLICVWGAVYLGMSFDAVHVTEPRFWGIFTAIVFMLVGKLWDLEIQKYLPGNMNSGTDSDDANSGDD